MKNNTINNQEIQELDKWNWQTFGQAHQEEKTEDPSKQDKKWKRGNNNRYHRDTKIHKRVLWTVICQQNGQPRRNEQIFRNIQPSKTESGRNRQSEQTDH